MFKQVILRCRRAIDHGTVCDRRRMEGNCSVLFRIGTRMLFLPDVARALGRFHNTHVVSMVISYPGTRMNQAVRPDGRNGEMRGRYLQTVPRFHDLLFQPVP